MRKEMSWNLYRTVVLTVSDRSAQGIREDQSGPEAVRMLEEAGYQVVETRVLPDERDLLAEEMKKICDEHQADLILTTGGTGFSMRDWTPEATLEIAHRQVPGISEALRAYSLKITPRAMLSRGVSVIREQTLIINLPGSPKAVRENLEYLLPALGTWAGYPDRKCDGRIRQSRARESRSRQIVQMEVTKSTNIFRRMRQMRKKRLQHLWSPETFGCTIRVRMNY